MPLFQEKNGVKMPLFQEFGARTGELLRELRGVSLAIMKTHCVRMKGENRLRRNENTRRSARVRGWGLHICFTWGPKRCMLGVY
jgi:hypothetical protein